MPRYRLEAFDNTDGLGDVSLEVWEEEARNREAAVHLGVKRHGGPDKRMWVKVDELWEGVVVSAIEVSILEALRDGPKSLEEIDALTRRLPQHVREALKTLERKGLIHQGPPFTFALAPKESLPCLL